MRFFVVFVLLFTISQAIFDQENKYAGRWRLRSTCGSYFRALEDSSQPDNSRVELVAERDHCAIWYIEQRVDMVTLQPQCTVNLYLAAKDDGSLFLGGGVYLKGAVTIWKPHNNSDGTWSFTSVRSDWLIADGNGTAVRTAKSEKTFEHQMLKFSLESLTENEKEASTKIMTVISSSVPTKVNGEAIKHKLSEKSIQRTDDLNSEEASGQWALKSVHGTFLRGWKGHRGEKEEWEVDFAPHLQLCEHWFIEDRHGKVALRHRCSETRYLDKYLAVDDNGTVILADLEWKAQEQEWGAVRNEDFTWSFQSSHGAWLSASPNASALTLKERNSSEIFSLEPWKDANMDEGLSKNRWDASSEDHDSQWDPRQHHHVSTEEKIESNLLKPSKSILEIYREEIALKRMIALKSVHNTYLRVEKQGQFVNLEFSKDYHTCKFWKIEERAGKIVLRPPCMPKIHYMFFLRGSKSRLVDIADIMESHELWTPVKNDDGTWSFQSAHGTWLRATPDGEVTLQAYRNEETKFSLETVPGHDDETTTSVTESSSQPADADTVEREILGMHSLKSSHGTFLRYEKHGKFEKVSFSAEQQKWHIGMTWTGKAILMIDKPTPHRSLRGNKDRSVDLAKEQNSHEKWSPFKNGDGSWSFQSAHGTWLSARPNGEVKLDVHRNKDANFWLIYHPEEIETKTSGPIVTWPLPPFPEEKPPHLAHSTDKTSIFSPFYLIIGCLVFALIVIVLHVRNKNLFHRNSKSKQQMSLSYRNLVDVDLQT